MKKNKSNFNYVDKSYKDFVIYFFKLNDNEKKYIIKNVYNYRSNNFTPKNKTFDMLNNMYEILLQKIKYNELNGMERNIYEYINAYLIYYNKFETNMVFDLYCDKYLSNITINNINNKILLITQNVVDILNKKYHLDVKIVNASYEYETKVLASVDIFSKQNEIFINKNMSKIEVDNKNLFLSVARIIFIILHEYKHILQYYDIINSKSITNKSLIDKVYLREITYDFYNKYHNYFFTERNANDFAFSVLKIFLMKYFDNDIYTFVDNYNKIETILYNKFGRVEMSKMKSYIFQKKVLLFIYDLFNLETDNTLEIKRLIKEKDN